ncbi:Der GTPase-activating protein YihI [Vibrio sp. RC27]
MSRNKKVRSTGIDDVIVIRQRSESDVEGRLRKKSKKRKGLKSGARHSLTDDNLGKASKSGNRDPRLGSKKKIPLIVEPKKKPTKAERLVLAEQELAQIESDAQFNVLLARLDNGEKLGVGLQTYVDQRLDRIEALMKILGIDMDEEVQLEDEDEQMEAPIVAKERSKSLKRDDDDLLSDFEDTNLDEWKG